MEGANWLIWPVGLSILMIFQGTVLAVLGVPPAIEEGGDVDMLVAFVESAGGHVVFGAGAAVIGASVLVGIAVWYYRA